MTSFNQIQRQGLSEQTTGVARFFAGLGRSLSRLGTMRAGVQTNDLAALSQPSEGLARAVEADSNLELDWLWASTQMQRVSERRYCLRRALAINPESEMALRDLARIGW
jgi:hypothetical protein